jgi:hypothetical protein
VQWFVVGEVIGPHRLVRISHVESKNLTAADVMNVLLSRDRLLVPNPGFRDSFVAGTLNIATWLPFVTTPHLIQINNEIPHGITVYKVGYLNATAGVVNCGLIIQVEQ